MNDPVYDVALVDTFLTLQIFGAIAFAFIVLSACIFPGVNRKPIWFSFCISWIVYCVSYSFLVFVGQHRHPVPDICVAQAALIYAAPLLAGATSLGLVLHLLLCTISALSRSTKNENKSYPIIVTFLVWTPWMIWIAVIVTVLVLGITHMDHIAMSANGTYCVIKDTLVPKVVGIAVIIICVDILAAEALIAKILYFNRAIEDVVGQSLTMIIRIFIFTLIGIAGILCGLVFTVTHSRGVQFDIIISALPPAAALIFGSQMDLMKGWMFWTWSCKPKATPTQSPSVSTDPQELTKLVRHLDAPPSPITPVILQTPKRTLHSSRQAIVQASFLHI